MSNHTLNLTTALQHYLLDHSLRETPEMQELRTVTAQLPEHNMQIAPEQAQFMQLLIRLTHTQCALEIGTFTGYSALSVALALPDNGTLVCCDINDQWIKIARPFWRQAGVEDKIDFRKGAALDTLQQLIANNQAKSFDFAFIDTDKENYLNYYEYCLQLVKPGGLILIDNTLWDGSVCDINNQEASTLAIRELNNIIHKDERVFPSLLPIADGLTIALVNEYSNKPGLMEYK